MKKILIALDYDPLAEKVAQAGYTIAKALGAEILLLHVVDDPAFYSAIEYSPVMGFVGFTSPEQYNVTDYLHTEAERFLMESKNHLGDERIAIRVTDGSYSEAILQNAHEFGAELIVIGTHSRRGFDKLLMGSLSEKIVHQSSIPVLVVPAEKKEV